MRCTTIELILALTVLPCIAAAQSPTANPVSGDSRPLRLGLLVQGGFGVTQDRGGFKFLMAGVNAGKVLTPTVGHGFMRGNFELGVEVFPLWQSYTPVTQRQNCLLVAGTTATYSCSTPFNIGGTFTGISITPDVLRWNLAGTRRFTPWMQGAGGMIWTNHKYPSFGGPPACLPSCVVTSPGNTLANNSANADSSVWNFTPQFGVGVHYFMSAKRSIDIGANAIHISSASLGDKNPGVNASVQFTVGYSWWK